MTLYCEAALKYDTLPTGKFLKSVKKEDFGGYSCVV